MQEWVLPGTRSATLQSRTRARCSWEAYINPISTGLRADRVTSLITVTQYGASAIHSYGEMSLKCPSNVYV
jgi:hypothetical protein